jgi:hypothetical protein
MLSEECLKASFQWISKKKQEKITETTHEKRG